MKKILFIIAFFVGVSSQAQQRYIIEKQIPDTITVKVQDEITYMRAQLSLSQTYFNSALACYVMSGLAQVMYLSLNKSKTILYTSIGLSGLGTVLVIVSHKYIGKAGIGVGGNGVFVRYTF